MKEWYAVKGLFRWHSKSNDETEWIEERVVLFRTDSFEGALKLAKKEAKIYCKPDRKANFKIGPIGWWDVRLMFDPPGAGIEVFSRRCVTKLSGDAFVKRYYPASHDQKTVRP
jgi:hypothetical protein